MDLVVALRTITKEWVAHVLRVSFIIGIQILNYLLVYISEYVLFQIDSRRPLLLPLNLAGTGDQVHGSVVDLIIAFEHLEEAGGKILLDCHRVRPLKFLRLFVLGHAV